MNDLHEKLEAAHQAAGSNVDDDRALVVYLEGIFRALHDQLLLMTVTLLVDIDDRAVRSLGQMLSTALRLRGQGSSVLEVAARVRGKHHQ